MNQYYPPVGLGQGPRPTPTTGRVVRVYDTIINFAELDDLLRLEDMELVRRGQCESAMSESDTDSEWEIQIRTHDRASKLEAVEKIHLAKRLRK